MSFVCSKCKVSFENKTRVSYCKPCMANYVKIRYLNNREKLLKNQKDYIDRNKEKVRNTNAEYKTKNLEKCNLLTKLWKQNNKSKVNTSCSKRRAALNNAVPKWLTENDFWMIEQAYELAQERSKIFKFDWHVDHVIPLKGSNVCGLHTPYNLQVIPAKDNLRKRNFFITT